MAFPVTITNNGSIAPGTTSFPGPLRVGTVFYTFPLFGGGFLNCFKSTDGGNTWVQVGGNSAAVENNTEYTSLVVGTKIYTVCIKPGVGGTRNIQVIAFDTGTDTWVAPVDTGNTQGFGGNSNEFLAASYRVSDNTIIVCTTQTNATPLRTFYFVYNIGTATAGPQIPCGEVGADLNNWDCRAILPGNGFTHFYFIVFDGLTFAAIHTQSISDGGVLSAVQLIDSSVVANSPCYFETGDGTTICLGWTPDTFNANPTLKVFSGTSGATLTFAEQDYVYNIGSGFLNNSNAVSLARDTGTTWMFIIGILGSSNDGYVTDSGSGFGTFNDLGDNNYVFPYSQSLSSVGLVVLGNLGLFFYLFPGISPPPPPAPPPIPKAVQGGGTYFPRFVNKSLLHAQIARVVGPVHQIRAYREFAPLSWLYDFPNGNDICLSREWRLYNQIDPTALACARKPDCFTGEEGARPWVEAPPGAVTFNPDKAIPLPAPAAVDVVVMSFRVPIGFDGIILAQYHGYRGAGTFIEASGDIIWRVRVNGRYLRDMGNMQLSIGSPQTLSPCPGGLWVLSGNLVEYVVSAPNGTGSLPLPGQGFILTGLHGWFYPRV